MIIPPTQSAPMRDAYEVFRPTVKNLFAFSFIINLLTLAVPLYMLQIYDRVLTSRSIETLILLTAIVAGALILMGVMDYLRSQASIQIGRAVDSALSYSVFESVYREARSTGQASNRPLDYLNALFQFLTGNGFNAMFDAPWIPLFLIVLLLLHPIFALIGVIGAVILYLLARRADFASREPAMQAGTAASQARDTVDTMVTNMDAVAAMGMRRAIHDQWLARQDQARAAQATSAGVLLGTAAISKSVRFAIQVAALCAGAFLAIQAMITPGTMIAAVIILGRLLAPVEQIIANWRQFLGARSAIEKLDEYFLKYPARSEPLVDDVPGGSLSAEGLAVMPPGGEKPVLMLRDFQIPEGKVVGIIGPSGAGKSSMLRVLSGIWDPAKGTVRVDGADIALWGDRLRQRTFGYLPQEVQLFRGNVAENISRFDTPDPHAVIAAAKTAGAHDLILALPDGYETDLGPGGNRISGGQKQRVGLARALYGDPKILFLDEPNANLDDQGLAALSAAITTLRQRGTTVLVVTHRQDVLRFADLLMLVRDGRLEAFGPRAKVLDWMAHEHKGAAE